MAQAARARPPQSGGAAAPAPRRPRWLGPLVAGLAFGLAYGVTQRLVTLNVGKLIHFGQGFDVQVFPGTSLESLRLRFGAADAELRGNLELQELERQRKEDADPAEPAKAEDASTPDDQLDPGPDESEPASKSQSAQPEAPSAPPATTPAAPSLPAPPPVPSRP